MRLPKSLNLETLMAKPVPGDMTIGEMRKYIMTTESIAAVKAASNYPDQVRVRILDNNGKEASDDMTMSQFRREVKAGKLRVAIDDGEGGALVA